MSRTHIAVLAAVGAAFLIAGCGGTGGQPAAPASTAVASPSAAALHGAAAEQCAAFAVVYQEITTRMSDVPPADDGSISEALGQHGTDWDQELEAAAGPSGAATPASLDMSQAAVDLGFANLDAQLGDSVAKDWAKTSGALRGAHLACGGQ